MTKRQKGKGKKRANHWHRGGVAGKRWLKAIKLMPMTGIEIDHDLSEPKPIKGIGGKPLKGDVAP